MDEHERSEFLMRMYEQMFSNINRHILVTWELLPVLGGTLGAIAIQRGAEVKVEVTSSIIILLSAWLAVNALDSNEWVTRNFSIIRNIERQFMRSSDHQEIHYFFAKNPSFEIIRHFAIQIGTAVVLCIGAIVWLVVETNGTAPWLLLPAGVLVLSMFVVTVVYRSTRSAFERFLIRSPGLSK